MLPIQQLQELIQGKKVAFIGAGVSHKRCIEQFVELGAQVTLCDQKKSLDDFGDYADTLRRLKVNLSLGEHYTDGFAGQDIIMRTPGYEYYKPALQAALKAGAMVTSEVELFFEFCPCEIVAVTGSDGKTTTTTLISKMFEAAGRKVFLGGNIGAALLPQVLAEGMKLLLKQEALQQGRMNRTKPKARPCNKPFDAEERQYLCGLDAVDECGEKRITWNRYFIRYVEYELELGARPVDVFRSAGVGPEVIGRKRIERCVSRWRRQAAKERNEQ